MQVALKDLELRGAGNLLGGEQSGHIAGVGFDLYLRMIGEAVNTFRGEETLESAELTLELPVAAHIPETFLESERLRLEAYQKFSAASHPNAAEEAVDLVLEELRDRYGDLPPEVLALAAVSRLRRRAARLGLSKVLASGQQVRLEPVALPDSRQMRMQRLYPGSRFIAASQTVQIPMPVIRGEALRGTEMLDWVSQLFENLLEDSPGEG
jgi:transcription-repair coupling factor (superfamily II helicase)